MITLPDSLPKYQPYHYDYDSDYSKQLRKLIDIRGDYYGHDKPAPIWLNDIAKARELVKKMHSLDIEIQEANLAAAVTIQQARQALEKWFLDCGFSKYQHSEIDLTKGAKYKRAKNVDAHWLVGIQEAFGGLVPHRGFIVTADALTQKYNEINNTIDAAYGRAAQSKLALDRENETKRAMRKQMFVVFELATKYKLEPANEQNPQSVADHILSQDKYMNLAWAMMQTRGDWSEGYYRVESALRNFELATPIDTEIEQELSELCDGDQDDGRVFRDCNFNYGFILETLANQALYDDLKKLAEVAEID